MDVAKCSQLTREAPILFRQTLLVNESVKVWHHFTLCIFLSSCGFFELDQHAIVRAVATTTISTVKPIPFHLYLKCIVLCWDIVAKYIEHHERKKLVLNLNDNYKPSIPRHLNLFYLFTSIDWLDQELEVRHLDPRCVSLWPQRKANKPAVDKNGRNGPMNREVGLWMSRQLNLSKIGTRNHVEIILAGKFRNGIVRRISRSTSKCV